MEELRERLEAYFESVHRARHRAARQGVDPGPDLSEVDARFDDLSSGDPLDGLRSEEGGAESARDARRRLIAALESAFLSAATRDPARELRERRVAVERGARPRDEPDRERRRELFSRLDDERGEEQELRDALWERRREARARLGYESGRERAGALHPDVDFEAWASGAERLLGASDGAYRDLLRAALRRASIPEESANAADVPWLHRAPELDARFPSRKLVDLLDFTTATLGLEVGAVPGLEVETGGDARGLSVECFPIREPGEVVLLSRGPGGVDGLRAHLAGAARAFQHAYCSSALPVETRRVADPALRLGFALLLERCAADPLWIAEGPAALRSGEMEQGVRLRDLMRLRRWAVEVGSELEISRRVEEGAPHDVARRHADALVEATGIAHPRADALDHLDEELASVHRLRAACFASRLSSHLRDAFGRRFWRVRAAGDLLKELWNTGGTYDADEMAGQLGIGPLDVQALIEEVPA